MKGLLSVLKSDFHRAFLSWKVFLTMILIVFINLLSVASEQMLSSGKKEILYLYEITILGGSFTLLTMFLCLLPFGSAFCEDWKNQFIRPSIIRTNRSVYAWSKVITVGASSFCLFIISNMATIIILCIVGHPMIGEHFKEYGYELYNTTTFGQLININPFLFLFVRVIMVSVQSMFWSVFSLTLSAFFTNVFVVYSSPIIAYYISINTLSLFLPPYLRFDRLLYGSVDVGGPFMSVIYIVIYFIGLVVVAGSIFDYKVKERLNNG